MGGCRSSAAGRRVAGGITWADGRVALRWIADGSCWNGFSVAHLRWCRMLALGASDEDGAGDLGSLDRMGFLARAEGRTTMVMVEADGCSWRMERRDRADSWA
ncbi:hypothetical protein ACLOJK_025417 [Asimina triloba]